MENDKVKEFQKKRGITPTERSITLNGLIEYSISIKLNMILWVIKLTK